MEVKHNIFHHHIDTRFTDPVGAHREIRLVQLVHLIEILLGVDNRWWRNEFGVHVRLEKMVRADDEEIMQVRIRARNRNVINNLIDRNENDDEEDEDVDEDGNSQNDQKNEIRN